MKIYTITDRFRILGTPNTTDTHAHTPEALANSPKAILKRITTIVSSVAKQKLDTCNLNQGEAG